MNADDITLYLLWVMRSNGGCEGVCTRTYCHLLMFPGSCTPHTRAPPELGEERLHDFQNLFKGGEDPPPPPHGTLLQAADRCCSRCSVITGQAYGHFLGGRGGSDRRSRRSAGGTIHLYLPLSQACYARTPSLALRGEAGGLADPRGCGSNNPCSPVSKCRSAAEQLNVAGEAVGEPLQALER